MPKMIRLSHVRNWFYNVPSDRLVKSSINKSAQINHLVTFVKHKNDMVDAFNLRYLDDKHDIVNVFLEQMFQII